MPLDITPEQHRTVQRVSQLANQPWWITLTVGVSEEEFRARCGTPDMDKSAIGEQLAAKVVDLITNGDPEASPNPIFVRPEHTISSLGGTVALNPEKPFNHHPDEGYDEYQEHVLLELHLLVTVDPGLWEKHADALFRPVRASDGDIDLGPAHSVGSLCNSLVGWGEWAHDMNMVDWGYLWTGNRKTGITLADDTTVKPNGDRVLRDGTVEPFQP